MLLAGLAVGAAALFAGGPERKYALQIAIVSAAVGGTILICAWWVARGYAARLKRDQRRAAMWMMPMIAHIVISRNAPLRRSRE